MFLNQGKGRLENASHLAGTFASRAEVTRGLAFGDIDNDGDVDLVTNDLANRLRVFRNCQIGVGATSHHWLQVLAINHGRVDVGALHQGDNESWRPGASGLAIVQLPGEQ